MQRATHYSSLLIGLLCLAACSSNQPPVAVEPASPPKPDVIATPIADAAPSKVERLAEPVVPAPAPLPQIASQTRLAENAPSEARLLAKGKVAGNLDVKRAEMAPPPPGFTPPPATFVAPSPMPMSIAAQPANTERYQHNEQHGIMQTALAPVSTFSIDVDTGSYSNVRRMLNQGQLPPRDAVRVEELVNYFPYTYPLPQDDKPFAVSTELAPTPWNPHTLLLRIGVQAADVAKTSLPPANLVFLVDVSGSMDEPAKLPLLKNALKLFVNQLRPQDHVSLVTYASGTRVVLPPTAGNQKAIISAAIDDLLPGGSTAGAAGIELAYKMAEQGMVKSGINRILLATDGDFNVGITRFETLKNRVEEKRKSGISLSTLGFGDGNYNDQLMEQLADAGDGAYSYIDTLNEAQKVLVDEFTSTLATVAHDVKIQLEFNPNTVLEYRQIGFENRALKREDFNNDKVDAGEIGSGHRVTALYEITLAGQPTQIDPLRYGNASAVPASKAAELGFLRLRYKSTHGDASKLLEVPIERAAIKPTASTDLRFAAAVAAFGQRLNDGGKYLGKFDLAAIGQLANNARGEDRFGYRGEFVRLVHLADGLAAKTVTPIATIAE